MNLFAKQKETDRYQNKVMVTKEEMWGGKNQEFEINRYTLLYIKQINNKGLLYSTENQVQYPMIKHNGKEY